MNEALIKLFGRVEIVRTGRISHIVPASYVHTLNTTIAALGYTFDRDVMRELASSTEYDFSLFLSELVRALTDITVANRDYQVLFAGFPYDSPGENRHLMVRVSELVRQHIGYTRTHALLPCGHLIDPGVFDVSKFGVCPICHHKIPSAQPKDSVEVEYDPMATPLKRLGVADTQFLTDQANALMASPVPLSLDERAFLVSRLFQLDPPLTVPDNPHPEVLPLAWCCLSMRGASHLMQPDFWDDAVHLIRSADDVVRIAAFLTDPMSDLSLSGEIWFDLKLSQIEIILRLLDELNPSKEDMSDHAGHWRNLFQVMKPIPNAMKRRYPRASAILSS